MKIWMLFFWAPSFFAAKMCFDLESKALKSQRKSDFEAENISIEDIINGMDQSFTEDEENDSLIAALEELNEIPSFVTDCGAEESFQEDLFSTGESFPAVACSEDSASETECTEYSAYRALLNEYRKVWKSTSVSQPKPENRIYWKFVDVVGWPQDVIFYSKSTWSKADDRKLIEAVEEGKIRFVLKEFSEREAVPLRTRIELNDRLLSASTELFGGVRVAWTKIKMLCPWIHLMHGKIIKLDPFDLEKLQNCLEILEEAKREKIGATEKRAGTEEIQETFAKRIKIDKERTRAESNLLQVQTQSLLLARYKQLKPTANIINWRKVQVTGWPQEVIFYQTSCWLDEDCWKLQQVMHNINFSYRDSKQQRLSPEFQAILRGKIKEFFLLYFNRNNIKWALVKEQVPEFHLNLARVSDWTYRDVEMMQKVIIHFKEKYPHVKFDGLDLDVCKKSQEFLKTAPENIKDEK